MRVLSVQYAYRCLTVMTVVIVDQEGEGAFAGLWVRGW